MTRLQLVEDISYVISKHKVYSSIEINGVTILYLYWNVNNYIQVEGFDTENIYLIKYINDKKTKSDYVMKLHKAPYKILRKLHTFLTSYYPIIK
jgi:hypothetical protein